MEMAVGPDDYQLSQLQSTEAVAGSGRNRNGSKNHRKNVSSHFKYSNMTKDSSAISSGNYQFLERGGRVINKSLSNFEANQLGIVLDQGPRGKSDRPNQMNHSY
jgi:hypothetical protein